MPWINKVSEKSGQTKCITTGMQQHMSFSTDYDSVRHKKNQKAASMDTANHQITSWKLTKRPNASCWYQDGESPHNAWRISSQIQHQESLVCQCCQPQWNKAFIVSFTSFTAKTSLNTVLLIPLPTWIVCPLTTGTNSSVILFSWISTAWKALKQQQRKT